MDYFKLLNRTALVLLIIFAVWYYQPDNREVRGIDPCSYYTHKENITCECTAYKSGELGVTKYFFPNGSMVKKNNNPNSRLGFYEDPYYINGGFNVSG
jgi:hypothetical protein